MPNLKPKEPVEEYKLTKEQKAFYQMYQKINQVSQMIKQGLQFQAGKLQAMQQAAMDIEGKKKQLMMMAPEQSTLEVEDEGIIQQ